MYAPAAVWDIRLLATCPSSESLSKWRKILLLFICSPERKCSGSPLPPLPLTSSSLALGDYRVSDVKLLLHLTYYLLSTYVVVPIQNRIRLHLGSARSWSLLTDKRPCSYKLRMAMLYLALSCTHWQFASKKKEKNLSKCMDVV